MTDTVPALPWPPIGPGPRYENRHIFLPHLAAETMRAGSVAIEKRTFIGCRFEGPAVLLPVSGNSFNGCDMGNSGGDLRNLLLHPVGKAKVVGAIPVKDCVFEGCFFWAVGFTGAPAFLEQFLKAVGKGEGA